MSLHYLYAAVSWVLFRWHQLFTLAGLDQNSALNWALSIVFLVVTARLILFRSFLKQVRYQRKMAAMAPELAAIKAKYKDDRPAQQRAIIALQQAEGFNPIAGLAPMLLQIPIFISLFHVLRHLSHAKLSAANARLFGETLLGGSFTSVRLVTLFIVLLSAAATFYTQRLAAAASPTKPEGTAATVQRLMAVGIPISALISGVIFPLGVVIYWWTSNTWSLGQQVYVNRFHPHGGGAARSRAR